MTREEGLELVKQNIQNQNLIKHCLAVEAVMRALARNFKDDEEKWGLAGLLHDIDYEKTKDDPQAHSLLGARMLEDLGMEKDISEAVKTHNEAHGIPPETLMAKVLYVTDPLTGLVVAATLVLPSKKIADLTPENVLNRFGEKAFARGVNREIIKKCEELILLKLEEFVKIGLEAMKGISRELGL
ncbi:MAG: HDIG domain-containing metalloprotein [Patescibacteria group bacterium]